MSFIHVYTYEEFACISKVYAQIVFDSFHCQPNICIGLN